jgi:hypothetical protein
VLADAPDQSPPLAGTPRRHSMIKLAKIDDDLDAAVAEVYGWPVDLIDEQILERLVALNHERAEEESRGFVCWLRPDYQNPTGKQQRGVELMDDDAEGGRGKAERRKTRAPLGRRGRRRPSWKSARVPKRSPSKPPPSAPSSRPRASPPTRRRSRKRSPAPTKPGSPNCSRPSPPSARRGSWKMAATLRREGGGVRGRA